MLLDTNIIIMVIGRRLTPALLGVVTDPANALSISVVSFWEIAIKQRSGKLDLGSAFGALEHKVDDLGLNVLPLERRHAFADPQLPKSVTEPFDRMIVAIAEHEDMVLLTTDRKLLDHPLAWHP